MVVGRLDGWMDGWVDGWMNGWMDKRTDGWFGCVIIGLGGQTSVGWMDGRVSERNGR